MAFSNWPLAAFIWNSCDSCSYKNSMSQSHWYVGLFFEQWLLHRVSSSTHMPSQMSKVAGDSPKVVYLRNKVPVFYRIIKHRYEFGCEWIKWRMLFASYTDNCITLNNIYILFSFILWINILHLIYYRRILIVWWIVFMQCHKTHHYSYGQFLHCENLIFSITHKPFLIIYSPSTV